jgi:hypothetical protein
MLAPAALITLRQLAPALLRSGHLLLPLEVEDESGPSFDVVRATDGVPVCRLGPAKPEGALPQLGYTPDDLRPVPTPHGKHLPKMVAMLQAVLAGRDLLASSDCPTVRSMAVPVELCTGEVPGQAAALTLGCHEGRVRVGPWTLDSDGLAASWAVELEVDHPGHEAGDLTHVSQRGLVTLRSDQLDDAFDPAGFLLRWAAFAVSLAVCESSPLCPTPTWRLRERQLVPLRHSDPDTWLASRS